MRRRLQEAALEFYQDGGYDRTTAAEIAAKAGVTGRTFFRHFADKREVLFGGEDQFAAALAAPYWTPHRICPLWKPCFTHSEQWSPFLWKTGRSPRDAK